MRDRLAKRPRWHVHLTPTSSSWLNPVERLFATLTERQPRRSVHRSAGELRVTIESLIERHDVHPKPVRWTKSASDVPVSVERSCIRNTPAKV